MFYFMKDRTYVLYKDLFSNEKKLLKLKNQDCEKMEDLTESLKIYFKKWGSFPFQLVAFKDEGIDIFIFLFWVLVEIGSTTAS